MNVSNDNRRPSRVLRFLAGDGWWIAPSVLEIAALVAAVAWVAEITRIGQ